MNYQIVILAAGKGTRMNSDLPKVLMPLGGSTMIQVLLSNLEVNDNAELPPVIVVGYESELVKNTLGDELNYVNQTEQLGTGHAVMMACPAMSKQAETIVVLYGDQPFVDKVMVEKLVSAHEKSEGPLTMGSVIVPDFDDWRSAFEFYGRIVRDGQGEVKKIIEYKDASESERAITEVNPAYFVFDKTWLCNHLEQVKSNNSQQEYYLTDLVGLAFAENHPITAVSINPQKGLGANTVEQLKTLEQMYQDFNN